MKLVEKSDSERQAEAQLNSIRELIRALRLAEESDDEDAREAAITAIDEDALEASVRCASWSSQYDTLEPDEYRILLCWGGPAVQITGDYIGGECQDANLQHQDWGTPWIDYYTNEEDTAILLEYAQHHFVQ